MRNCETKETSELGNKRIDWGQPQLNGEHCKPCVKVSEMKVPCVLPAETTNPTGSCLWVRKGCLTHHLWTLLHATMGWEQRAEAEHYPYELGWSWSRSRCQKGNKNSSTQPQLWLEKGRWGFTASLLSHQGCIPQGRRGNQHCSHSGIASPWLEDEASQHDFPILLWSWSLAVMKPNSFVTWMRMGMKSCARRKQHQGAGASYMPKTVTLNGEWSMSSRQKMNKIGTWVEMQVLVACLVERHKAGPVLVKMMHRVCRSLWSSAAW